MFDPTIYDNLKVVIEGELYDLDLNGEISILDRHDIVDLAHLSRSFSLTFQLEDGDTIATIHLLTSVEDLASELLDRDMSETGCDIEIQFTVPIHDIDQDGNTIKFLLAKTWRKYFPFIEQRISFPYGTNRKPIEDLITITFNDKWDEEDMELVPGLIRDIFETLAALNRYFSNP